MIPPLFPAWPATLEGCFCNAQIYNYLAVYSLVLLGYTAFFLCGFLAIRFLTTHHPHPNPKHPLSPTKRRQASNPTFGTTNTSGSDSQLPGRRSFQF